MPEPTKKRARKSKSKQAEDTGSRGRKNAFTGFKFAFLTLLAAEYVVWRAEGRSGPFYDYVVGRFFRKFGYTTEGDFTDDPAEDPVELSGVDGVLLGCRTQAEADMYKERYDALRTVSL